MSQKILIMAGGTGGHIFPAMAVARELTSRGMTVQWLGAERGMESRLVDTNEFPLHLIPVSALKGGGILRKLKFPFSLMNSIIRVTTILRHYRPDLVIGFGGYASGPGGMVSRLMGIPLVLHEQNAVAGFTNKWLSKVATKVIQAFPNTFGESLGAVTLGNPVRADLLALREDIPEENRVTKIALKNILVLGGSLGAQSLNKMIPQAIANLQTGRRPQIWHQAGENKLDETNSLYQKLGVNARVDSFIPDMAEAYKWADLVICRSGASTVSEIAAIGKAAFFLPYPWHKDRQQFINAEYLVSANAGWIIPQDSHGSDELVSRLIRLLDNPEELGMLAINARRQGMPDSVFNIGELVNNLLQPDSGSSNV